jgi:hypothetical protein
MQFGWGITNPLFLSTFGCIQNRTQMKNYQKMGISVRGSAFDDADPNV